MSFQSKFLKCPQRQITADKREIKDFLKFPSATSFIRNTLGETTAMNTRKQKHAY